MLTLHDGTADYARLKLTDRSSLPSNVTWIDIKEGTADEIACVEKIICHHVPTLADLQEIETSSRLRNEHGVLCLSAPLVARKPHGTPYVSPVGFILTKDCLVTVRFSDMQAFTTFANDYVEDDKEKSSIGALIGLIDTIIDRTADVLEQVGSDLDALSGRVFAGADTDSSTKQPPARETIVLQEVLRKVGRNADLSSKIRDSLLGIGRIVSYVAGTGKETYAADLRAHLETQRNDILSLSDYEAHLSSKVQLLLDATMGLINIEQNNIIRVLTIVSVVGVPPTLVASMYGMNFHNMPELNWTYGYAYGLALIAASAVLPLVWFKKRGWL